jgi:hypothetical protein
MDRQQDERKRDPVVAASGVAGSDVRHTLLDLHSDHIRKVCRRIIIALVVLGAIGRLKQYIARPSYWNDEAAVVANVISRDWRELLKPLDYAQAAPPLFLWAERGLFLTFGANEYALRSLPLGLSILTIVLYAVLAWRILPPTSACWAVAWLSLFQKILHHGHDVKQYSGDLCVAVAMLLIVFGHLVSVSAGRRMVVLSVFSAAALWFSFPTVFLFGGIALSLFLECFEERWSGRVAWAGGCLLVLASFAGLSRVALSQGADPSLQEFWHASFPDFGHPMKVPVWLAREVYGIFAYPFDSFGLLTTLLAGFGCVALIKLGRSRLVLVLVLTLLLAFVAAALHRYPFPGRHRLGLYLVPLAMLILGAGAEGQNIGASYTWCRWWWVLPVPLVLLLVGQLAKDLAVREEDSTMRPVAAYVRSHRSLEEPIYLVGDSLGPTPASGRSAEFLCYWPDAPGKVRVGFTAPGQILAKRFWLIYSLKPPEKKPPFFWQQLLDLFPPNTRVLESTQPRRQSGAMLVEQP